jgi:sterol desaturase/sphingolipid hydroxylase (fatty acid hydroxylase superfamily)
VRTQAALYEEIDLELSWSEAELPERERTKHVHRLHPYLGKYVPQLVEAFLRRYGRPGGLVWDPFAGSGTTLVEANAFGARAAGCDVSAFNCLLARVKTAEYGGEALLADVVSLAEPGEPGEPGEAMGSVSGRTRSWVPDPEPIASGSEDRNPSPRVDGAADGPNASPQPLPEPLPDARVELARKVARIGGAATMAGAGVLATVGWAHATSPSRMWRRRRRDLGTGPVVWAGAVLGWDFIYYWNHRFMHEVRGLWAIHVVHHSSERYNLSTALRQPVSPFGVFVPYGLMAWAGVRPSLVEQARGINLLYQYWIHTDVIRTLGAGEEVLNTPSHHRVHHASNRRYIDRNHGSILIVWDRLFGTFTREDPDEPVVYGLTRNIRTYNPLTVVAHEYVDMLRDVAESTTWRDRVSFVLRGPGWAYRRRAELAGGEDQPPRAWPEPEPAPLQAAGR